MVHRLSAALVLVLLGLPAALAAQEDPLADPADPPAAPPASPVDPPASPEDQMAGEEAPIDELEAEQRAAERAARPAGAVAAEDSAVPEGEIDYSHDGQFYLRGGVALPFVFAIRYGDGPICSRELTDEGEFETFCPRIGSPLLDLDVGFGLTDSIELSFLGRLGITDDAVTNTHQIILGIGVRSYGSPHSQVKGYLAARIIADLTTENEPEVMNWGTVDIGGRGEFGLAIDAIRQLGFYLQLGASFLLLRGFYLIGDISAGLQVRIP